MISENIAKVKERIALSCAAANRDPASVALVAVTKGRAIPEINEAVSAGITDIGENRVQEALVKYNVLTKQRNNETTKQPLKWHLIGHLQTNKVKDAVRIFDLIHSVDSLRLLEQINKQAAMANKVQDVLLEVKTSPEETKSGVRPEEAEGFIRQAVLLGNIRVAGFMTIAPEADGPEEARPYFRALRETRDSLVSIRQGISDLRILSMGMSGDFEAAIKEGANMIRVGRAIFEQ